MAGQHVTPLGLAAAPANSLVLEASTVAGRTLAAVQVYAGAPHVGLVLRVEGTAARWAVTGIAFGPPAAVEAGRWGLSLRPVAHDGQLRPDVRLRGRRVRGEAVEELHAAIAAYLRGQRRTTEVRRPRAESEREARILGIWRERAEVPRCVVCGRPVDDDGGLFNLADMQLRRQCAEHYCPF